MEDFNKRLATEFTQAAELHRETTKLLEQCEPSSAQLCHSILAPPPGSENGWCADTLGRSLQHIVALMCWWVRYGDFETVLPEVIPGAKRSGILPSRKKSVAKAELEKVRTQRFVDPRHPLNWYVECKKTPKIRELLKYDCVAEALSVHSTGGWDIFRDVSVDFFDAVTRSIGLQGILRNGQGLTEADLIELARGMGLEVSIEPASGDPANAIRPLVWHSHRSTKTARPAFRVSGRHVECVFLVARPRSFLCTASKGKDSRASRTSDVLIEAAETNWPGDLNFGRGILRLVGSPDQTSNGTAALKSTVGLLLLAADAEKLHPADAKRSNDDDKTFLKDLKESLKVGNARLYEARIRPDQIARRVPSRTTTHENNHVLLRLDGKDFVFGQLVCSDAPDDVFDSVLLYDLHVWAIEQVSKVSADPVYKATVSELVKCGCWEKSWEATKQVMLALTPDASGEAVESAFSALWPSVLEYRKTVTASKELPEPQRKQIDTLLRDMVHATLSLLKKTGANAYPPRFCDREKAGEIDLTRWLAEDHWWQGSHPIELEVFSGTKPRVLEVDAQKRLQIYLPGFEDRDAADARLMHLPGVFWWSGGSPPRYVRLIHEHVTRPIIVAFSQGSAAPVDFAAALQSLKHAFSTGDGKEAFDDLIKATIQGDANAVRLLEYLRGDNRFQLTCFPRIEKHGEKWRPCQPMPEDEHVQWAFDNERVAKTLVTVTYALSPAESVAVYSKGSKSDSRELEAADAVQGWCDRVGKSAQGSQLHRATERYWAFGESLSPAVKIAAELLDQIGESGCIGQTTAGGEREPAIRDDGYNVLTNWLDAIGGHVTPGTWSAKEGSVATAKDQGSLPVEFSTAVPVRCVVVKQFGVTAAGFAQPFEGAVSAGPPFNGYEEIDEISRRYWAQHAVWDELAKKWSSVPAQSDNKTSLAGVLHWIYYNMAIKDDEADASDWKSDAKMRLVSILEEVCGWKPFPRTDEVELGPGGDQLAEERVIFIDGRIASSGTVRVLAKGFEDRRGAMLQGAGVRRK